MVSSVTMTVTDVHRTIDAVWRIESAHLIAALTRRVRDVGLAEELAQEALLSALEAWPRTGIPDNPGAWLMTTAKNRALGTSLRWNSNSAATPSRPRLISTSATICCA
jgi:predicted RNA polymerase sigma factor